MTKPVSFKLPITFDSAPIARKEHTHSLGLWIALGLAFIVAPIFTNEYWLTAILIPFLILSLAGIGLNLLTGYAGQVSLGAAGFMAVGAFATYAFLLRVPLLPIPLALIAGGLISALVGFLFGLPSSRIKGFYLMVTTLAAQFFIEWLFTKFPWFYNNASSGNIAAPRLDIFGYSLNTPVARYLATLIVVVSLTWVAINIIKSRIGRNWMAIRDMDTAAAVIGIPVVAYKRLAFAVSSFYLGIAGALWAFLYLGNVGAGSFDINRSFQILFIIIIGGMGSLAGNFIGAAFISFLPLLLNFTGQTLLGGSIDAGQLQNLQKVIFGALIIFLLIKEPEGLVRLFNNLADRFKAWPLRF